MSASTLIRVRGACSAHYEPPMCVTYNVRFVRAMFSSGVFVRAPSVHIVGGHACVGRGSVVSLGVVHEGDLWRARGASVYVV